jgi:hypothetical protein
MNKTHYIVRRYLIIGKVSSLLNKTHYTHQCPYLPRFQDILAVVNQTVLPEPTHSVSQPKKSLSSVDPMVSSTIS